MIKLPTSRFKRVALALLVLVAVIAASAFVAERTHTSAPTRTHVHIVTPFRPDGRLAAALRLQQVKGTCTADDRNPTSISAVNTFTCRLPANFDPAHPFPHHPTSYNCARSCTSDPCWRVPRSNPLVMVCLNGPLSRPIEGFQGILVRVTNQPGQATPGRSPFASQPWMFELTNGENCSAISPDKSFPIRTPPVLGYLCTQGNTVLWPAGPMDRSKPLWTIHAARTIEQAKAHTYPLRVAISEAWFVGNGPR